MDAGTQLGPYQVVSPLGKGGMGEVYRARDTKLDREVAIKVLSDTMAHDAERVARFEREAKLLASLNHPNIAAVYGFDESGGVRFLVMEYVEGQTLTRRLDGGVLPVDDTLDVATRIAEALEEAHDNGIIHRDLKPGNVMLTPGGKVKVLDFGLAKAMSDEPSSVTGADSPTITANYTRPGVVLGTAAYMSPEQARGRALDKRTDVWSFGVVLYEMLTGISPFTGETVSDSIGAILHKEIDLDRLPPGTPWTVRHVLRRCLERDRQKRYRDIGDVRIELAHADSTNSAGSIAASRPRRSSLVWVVCVVLAAAAGYACWSVWSSPAPLPPVIRSTIAPPEDAILVATGDLAGPAVLSRDGTKIAFVAKQGREEQRLFVRSLDSEAYQTIGGTDGATFPFWSWNGNSIGYFAHGNLRRYDLITRTNRVICPAPAGRGGAWLADHRIVFAGGFQSPISVVSAEGGKPVAVTTIDPARHTSHRWPSATPGGRSFIYIAVSHKSGRLAETAVILHVEDAPDVEITRAQFQGQIVDGNLLVLRQDTLYASPFDDTTGVLAGREVPVVEGVSGDMTTWFGAFSASPIGVLVYQKSTDVEVDSDTRYGGPTAFGESMRTAVLRRDGRPVRVMADGIPQNTTSLSPQYGYLAISGAPSGVASRSGFDIWIYRLARHEFTSKDQTEEDKPEQSAFDEPPRRLTFLPGTEVSPQWSPDGEWITFGYIPYKSAEDDTETGGLMRVRTSGGQPEMLIDLQETGSGNVIAPTDWSADGRYIVYIEGSWLSIGINDIRAFDLQTGQVITLVASDKDDQGGCISRDGKWLAYESNESGDWEVYVVPFVPGWENDNAQGLPIPPENARWHISIAGGRQPRWRRDGGELYYIASSDSLISVNVGSEGPVFNHDAGTALFKAPSEDGVQYDVSADGERFAFNGMVEDRYTTISLITNWQELLRKNAR
jgi:serine/threonine protein kinase